MVSVSILVAASRALEEQYPNRSLADLDGYNRFCELLGEAERAYAALPADAQPEPLLSDRELLAENGWTILSGDDPSEELEIESEYGEGQASGEAARLLILAVKAGLR